MADTYTQLFVHIIFSPKGRQNLIHEGIRDKIFKYMTGIIKNKKQKPMFINGMSDHIHILAGFTPDISISKLVQDIKTNTTTFIKKQKLIQGNFEWQKGFGAFTCSKSQVPTVLNYIQNQKIHHRKKSFREEYLGLLKKHEIDYNDDYLFEWYD